MRELTELNDDDEPYDAFEDTLRHTKEVFTLGLAARVLERLLARDAFVRRRRVVDLPCEGGGGTKVDEEMHIEEATVYGNEELFSDNGANEAERCVYRIRLDEIRAGGRQAARRTLILTQRTVTSRVPLRR